MAWSGRGGGGGGGGGHPKAVSVEPTTMQCYKSCIYRQMPKPDPERVLQKSKKMFFLVPDVAYGSGFIGLAACCLLLHLCPAPSAPMFQETTCQQP